MHETSRIKVLQQYRILDTPPENAFDDMVRMTSAIFDAPVALISFLDEERQWLKASVGTDQKETPAADSICKHLLYHPGEVLVISDIIDDDRFADDKRSGKRQHLRFYAGAPLTCSEGYVIGSLCIIDYQPRTISEFQKHTLQTLAQKVMQLLDERKEQLERELSVVKNEELIEKISDHSPGALFKFTISNEGEMSFPFVSKGISNIHPGLTPEMLKNNAALGFNTIHPDDLPRVYESIGNSFKTLTDLDFEFRIRGEDDVVRWHRAKANPEKRDDGVVWYGTLQDVTESKEYIATLEEIMFSISHIIRKPVTTMMGLVQMLNDELISEDKIRELVVYFNRVVAEMDNYTIELNNVFQQKKIRVISAKA